MILIPYYSLSGKAPIVHFKERNSYILQIYASSLHSYIKTPLKYLKLLWQLVIDPNSQNQVFSTPSIQICSMRLTYTKKEQNMLKY